MIEDRNVPYLYEIRMAGTAVIGSMGVVYTSLGNGRKGWGERHKYRAAER